MFKEAVQFGLILGTFLASIWMVSVMLGGN